MQSITPEIIAKLDSKVRCCACRRILFEGVLERAAINIQCPSCGIDNAFFITGTPKERFTRNGRSIIDIINQTGKQGGK